MHRRFSCFIRVISLAIAVAASLPAAARDWPTQPVRILVSFPPGGTSDLVARLLADHLSRDLVQQVVVENKPGAAGTTAAAALKQARADGYTLMLSNLSPFSIAPALLPDVPYDPVTDFTHITYIGGTHLALFVRNDLKVRDLSAFIAAAKAHPNDLNYGSSGVASWGHVVGERFQSLAGVRLQHIPYRGSAPMVLDFRAGVITAMFDAVPQNLPLIGEGVAVPLAVTAARRLPPLPDVPTFTELGYDIVAENWLGISAPAGLDRSVAGRIDMAVRKVLATPSVSARLTGWGIDTSAGEDMAFADFVAAQFVLWKASMEGMRER